MKKLTVHLLKNFSSDLTSLLINCTRLNLSSQKLSIENQSLPDSSFCNMLSSECWRFIINSLKSFVIPKSMKSLNWIPTLLMILFSRRKKNEWEAIRFRYCTDSFTGNATGNFFPRTCCSAHKKHDNRETGLFKEEFRCCETLCLCSKTYCCYDRKSNKYKFSSKGLNKRTLEDC